MHHVRGGESTSGKMHSAQLKQENLITKDVWHYKPVMVTRYLKPIATNISEIPVKTHKPYLSVVFFPLVSYEKIDKYFGPD